MLPSLTLQEKYKIKRIQRKQKNKIKHKIICTLSVTICIIALFIYILPPITSSSSSLSYNQLLYNHNNNHNNNNNNNHHRHLLEEEEEEYPEGYPPDLLTAV